MTPDFKLLFESVPGLYLILTPEFQIVAVSNAYLKATMTKRELILGKNLFEVFPDNPDDPAATGVQNLKISLQNVLRNRQTDTMAVQKYDIQKPLEAGGGFEEKFWSPLNSPVLGANGEILYIIHRVEDVTDFIQTKQREHQHLKTAEALIEKNQRMEAEIYMRSQEVQRTNRELENKNKELESFSHTVAHDLRAPLRSLMGFSHIILEDFGSELSIEAKDYFERIVTSSKRMASLVDGLLNLSRISRTELRWEKVDLSAFANIIVADFQKLAPDRKTSIRIENGLVAQGDGKLIYSVLQNLLDNAWKFTALNPLTEISFGADERTFYVRDNGVGFDMKYAKNLFETFHRLHGENEFPGVGVGLATVRRVIERHGGRIWVKSEPGKGTTFYFTLEREH